MTTFTDLDDLVSFKRIVREHHASFITEIGVLTVDVVIDEQRLEVAHRIYASNVDQFSVLLGGGNPDQYKRAASLLDALNTSKVIVKYEATSDTEDAETGWKLGYSHNDLQDDLNAYLFYEHYHNEAAAFDLSFRFCDIYEPDEHNYDTEYAATVCNYLKNNNNLSMESFFIMFKSLMN